MKLQTCSYLVLLAPLALPLACGDDGDDSDTAAATETGTGGTDSDPSTSGPTTTPTSTDPTTGDPTTGDPTTGEPTTGEPTTGEPGTGTGGEDTAMIRVLHLGVNAPGVDVYANSEGPVIEGLEFRNSTEYLEVPAGDYTFQVTVAGDPPEDAVLTPETTLAADTMTTVAAIGDLNMTDDAPELQTIAVADDEAGIDAGNVRVTAIHAAPAVGQVDIWEVSDENNPALLVEDADFAAVAPLGDIPASPLVIGIDVDDDAVPDLTFDVDASGLGGLNVNVYANNDENGDVVLIAQLPDGTILPIAPN